MRKILRPQSSKRLVVALFLLLSLVPGSAEETVLFEEGFNGNGAGTRYTVAGGLISEVADHPGNGINDVEQVGPVYWGHSFDVSLVGVPAATPARRAVIAWSSELEPAQVSAQGLAMLDATIAWLTKDKTNLRVLMSPPAGGPGDQIIVERLTAKGATFTGDDVATPVPPNANFDLVIHSSLAASPSRFTNYPVPYLTYNGPDHDDELVSSIGETGNFNLGNVTVQLPDHPAAAGLTGSFPFFTGEVPLHMPGTLVPEGSAVVATYPIVDIPPVENLAEVAQMVAGTIETMVDEGTSNIADLESGASGNFSGGGIAGDRQPPGNPVGSFAIAGTGQISVKSAGSYGFALWVAGGGSLRIDTNGNGIDANDPVIEQDQVAIIANQIEATTNYGDFTFAAAGAYAFEWRAYSPTAEFGSEIFFTQQPGTGQNDPLDDQSVWAPLADWEGVGLDVLPINLEGEIAITKYEKPRTVLEERPVIVCINGPDEGGQVFGGGAFLEFEGSGFFAGAGLDKYGTAPKTLTLNPVNVSGKNGLKLKVLLAATTLDFETSDYLDILIDPHNSGNFSVLTHFSAPTANDKYFTNGTTRLDPVFKEAVFNIPDGATNLVIRFSALTTWWNEIVGFDYVRIVQDTGPDIPPRTIVWISEVDTPAGQEFKEALTAQGHTVTEMLISNPTAEEQAVLNAVDLVVVSRKTTSGTFNHAVWDDLITAPLILMTPYNSRSSRWGWFGGEGLIDATPAQIQADQPGHPVFDGLEINVGVTAPWHVAVDRGTSLATDPVINGGTRIASGGGGVVVAEWPAGTVAAGPRMLFCAGSREPDGSVIGDAGKYNLTATGAAAFLNAVNYMAGLEVEPPIDEPDDLGPQGSLLASYWHLDPKTVPIDGEPMHRAGDGGANSGWADDNVFNTNATGTFSATRFNYQGDDLTPIANWLGPDAASLSPGTAGNLDDGVLRFQGYLRVDAPGQQTFTFTSDDGSVLYIAGQLVIANDNSHGNVTVSGNYNFPSPGYYPVDVRYFNGDWTDPDNPASHGGANFIVDAGFDTGSLYGIRAAPSGGVPGLLGYWHFNEGAGAVAMDSSGNENHGTIIQPDGTWTEDPARGVVYGSSAMSYVDFGTILPGMTLENGFTWSFWANSAETDNNNIVFGNRWAPSGADFDPREFIKITPRVFEWHFNAIGENAGDAATMFPVGVWAHNLVVKDGANLTYYRDAIQIATRTITGTPINPQPLYLGGQNGLEMWSGLVSEVAIWNRALSAGEASQVYDYGLNGLSLADGNPVQTPAPGAVVPPLSNVHWTDEGLSLTLPAGGAWDVEYSETMEPAAWEAIAVDVPGGTEFMDNDPDRMSKADGYYRGVRR